MTAPILVPISPGELIDKITILEIKAARISDPAKAANVAHELALLQAACTAGVRRDAEIDRLTEELRGVNAALWDVEDDLRAAEAAGDFGPGFVALARSVYVTNDHRAALKRAINLRLGSALVEEKSYATPPD